MKCNNLNNDIFVVYSSKKNLFRFNNCLKFWRTLIRSVRIWSVQYGQQEVSQTKLMATALRDRKLRRTQKEKQQLILTRFHITVNLLHGPEQSVSHDHPKASQTSQPNLIQKESERKCRTFSLVFLCIDQVC